MLLSHFLCFDPFKMRPLVSTQTGTLIHKNKTQEKASSLSVTESSTVKIQKKLPCVHGHVIVNDLCVICFSCYKCVNITFETYYVSKWCFPGSWCKEQAFAFYRFFYGFFTSLLTSWYIFFYSFFTSLVKSWFLPVTSDIMSLWVAVLEIFFCYHL